MSIIKKLKKDFRVWRMLYRGLTVEEQIELIRCDDSILLRKAILRQKFDRQALEVLFHEGYKPREDSLGYIYYQRYGLDVDLMLQIIRCTDVKDMGLPKTLIRQFNLFYSGCSPEEERQLAIFLLSNADEEIRSFFRNLERLQDELRKIDVIGVNKTYADVIQIKKAAFQKNFVNLLPSYRVQKRILESGKEPLISLMARELKKLEAWYWGHLNIKRQFLIAELQEY